MFFQGKELTVSGEKIYNMIDSIGSTEYTLHKVDKSLSDYHIKQTFYYECLKITTKFKNEQYSIKIKVLGTNQYLKLNNIFFFDEVNQKAIYNFIELNTQIKVFKNE